MRMKAADKIPRLQTTSTLPWAALVQVCLLPGGTLQKALGPKMRPTVNTACEANESWCRLQASVHNPHMRQNGAYTVEACPLGHAGTTSKQPTLPGYHKSTTSTGSELLAPVMRMRNQD